MIANIKLPDNWVRNKCNNCPFSSFIHEKGSPDFYKCFLGYGELIDGAIAKYFPDIKPHCELEVEEDESVWNNQWQKDYDEYGCSVWRD